MLTQILPQIWAKEKGLIEIKANSSTNSEQAAGGIQLNSILTAGSGESQQWINLGFSSKKGIILN
jgi:hypothetical protein